jgi:hypothetical protein
MTPALTRMRGVQVAMIPPFLPAWLDKQGNGFIRRLRASAHVGALPTAGSTLPHNASEDVSLLETKGNAPDSATVTIPPGRSSFVRKRSGRPPLFAVKA